MDWIFFGLFSILLVTKCWTSNENAESADIIDTGEFKIASKEEDITELYYESANYIDDRAKFGKIERKAHVLAKPFAKREDGSYFHGTLDGKGVVVKMSLMPRQEKSSYKDCIEGILKCVNLWPMNEKRKTKEVRILEILGKTEQSRAIKMIDYGIEIEKQNEDSSRFQLFLIILEHFDKFYSDQMEFWQKEWLLEKTNIKGSIILPTEVELIKIIKEPIEVLADLHKNYTHGDFRAENMVYVSSVFGQLELKPINFNKSQRLEQFDKSKSSLSSMKFNFETKNDMRSLGLLIVQLILYTPLIGVEGDEQQKQRNKVLEIVGGIDALYAKEEILSGIDALHAKEDRMANRIEELVIIVKIRQNYPRIFQLLTNLLGNNDDLRVTAKKALDFLDRKCEIKNRGGAKIRFLPCDISLKSKAREWGKEGRVPAGQEENYKELLRLLERAKQNYYDRVNNGIFQKKDNLCNKL